VGAELAVATADGDARAVVAQLGKVARQLADGAEIAGVGIGVPGVIVRGTLRMAPNLPPFGDVDLAAALAAELGTEVLVDNDVNMATVGEHHRGLGARIDNFVFIAVGTGIGMGIVAGGRLVQGAGGAAGEIATMRVAADGAELEAVAGGSAVARRYGAPTALDVFAAAERGDATATAVLDEQAAAVAGAVLAVRSVLDPALVVFGGGIGIRSDFLAGVRAHIGDESLRIETSALGERAGVVGAAEAVKERLGV
jgi:predicted NBD/HSP70 family sugar kinase